jgi:dihydrofolate reductase
MRKLAVFNSVTLDGYFVDTKGDMTWAHKDDPEWNGFVAGNASGEAVLVFGRVTYEMMASWWPTPQALQSMPVVAERMNSLQKVVFSRTLDRASWSNTTLVKGDMVAAIRQMKREPGNDLVILGSGSIVAQLAQEGLIDEFQIALNPIALGAGRTMFAGVKERLRLRLTQTRSFANGNVFLRYERMV